MSKLHIMDLCEDKARKGDGAFAIAFAVLELAEAQRQTARAVHKLGLADAAIEAMLQQAAGVAVAINAVADAIQGAGLGSGIE